MFVDSDGQFTNIFTKFLRGAQIQFMFQAWNILYAQA